MMCKVTQTPGAFIIHDHMNLEKANFLAHINLMLLVEISFLQSVMLDQSYIKQCALLVYFQNVTC